MKRVLYARTDRLGLKNREHGRFPVLIRSVRLYPDRNPSSCRRSSGNQPPPPPRAYWSRGRRPPGWCFPFSGGARCARGSLETTRRRRRRRKDRLGRGRKLERVANWFRWDSFDSVFVKTWLICLISFCFLLTVPPPCSKYLIIETNCYKISKLYFEPHQLFLKFSFLHWSKCELTAYNFSN